MKRILFFIVLILSIFIIKNLIFSIYNLWQKQDLIIQAQKELEAEKKKNTQFKDKLSQVQSSQFIEEQARNKLFLFKPGESEVVIPKNIWGATQSADSKPRAYKPNWQKWLELFF